MKNILKKLGVIGLTLAVLAPFIELPKVNAADCANHLQNYMFLDKNYISLNSDDETFFEGYSSEKAAGGYQTYTHFPYAFLEQAGFTTTVTATEKNNFTSSNRSSELSQYWEYFNRARSTLSSFKDANKKGDIFVQDSSFSGNYIDNTILLHGEWSSYDADGYPILSNWQAVSGGKDYTIQSILDAEDLVHFKVEIKAAEFYNNNFQGTSTSVNPTYLQSVIDNGTNLWEDGNGDEYIPLSITRTIDLSEEEIEDMLNGYVFGYVDNNGTHIFTKNTTENASSINDSYTTLKEYLENPTSTASTHIKTNSNWDEEDLDFNTGKDYYWPVILNVEYTSCSQNTANWSVVYDDNVDDTSVNNLPSPQTKPLGTNINVSTDKPSRNGYVFTKWCETKDGSGTCYESGKTITSPTASKTITLYAQWAKEGSEDNKKTGVMSYIIGFAAVGMVAGGIYLVSKKKNLFKQI